jgi:hypothetical protein
MTEPVTELEEFRDVLEDAEDQVRRVQAGTLKDPDVTILAAAALPPRCGRSEYARLAALAHAGPSARVHLLLAGFPPSGQPALELATALAADPGGNGAFRVGDPPGDVFAAEGGGLAVPVNLDGAPPSDLVDELCRHVAHRAESEGVLEFGDLVPEQIWSESSIAGLSTLIGRIGRGDAVVALDDATPHWLVGGRTGAGKTVFLLDILYGLAARYSPDELSLYLLDFKEGVSFTEFIPTERDQTWLPHARAVGVESDRQYGVAVLIELTREMTRRSAAMKANGVSNLADLRKMRTDLAFPRIVTVIDEFHVLLQANDDTARRAVELLEEVARKGRSFGIHLILASQSITGIEALYMKGPSVFAQFGLRVALSGGRGVLDSKNHAADALPIGQVILNDQAGGLTGNRRARFPDADPHSLHLLRRRLWDGRPPGSPPPGVFVGYAEHTVDDEVLSGLSTGRRRKTALVGRAIDVGLPVAGLTLDPSPGRNLAVVGSSPVGADILVSIALGLAAQHESGTAAFYLAGLVEASDELVDDLATRLRAAGHVAENLDLPGYRDTVRQLREAAEAGRNPGNYLFVFGADAANSLLKLKQPETGRTGLEDFRLLLRDGPPAGTHVFGWWRGVRRLSEDLGANAKDDVSGIVALNVRGNELGLLIGQSSLHWSATHNRALLIDRQEDSQRLIIPFVTAGRYSEEF